MDWSYVAGYFDGEGHVGLHQTKRGTSTHGLFWSNTDRPSLEAMRVFMTVGAIYERGKNYGFGKKQGYVLSVGNKVALLHVLNHMIPCLLIKRAQAEALRTYLIDHVNEKRMANFGKVAAVSSQQLQAWYAQGESYGDIAKRLGVHLASVGQAFRLRGLEKRSAAAGAALMKGVPKSAETRARMLASRRAMWADPAFVARQAELRDRNNHTSAERMSIAIRAKWADPSYRERMKAVRKAQWAKPENRAAMSVAQRARRDKERSMKVQG